MNTFNERSSYKFKNLFIEFISIINKFFTFNEYFHYFNEKRFMNVIH